MSLLETAVDQVRNHKAISNVAIVNQNTAYLIVEADVAVGLPSRALRAGVSKTGVRAVERVTFPFTKEWPVQAPRITLRPDFPGDFPHMNPRRDGRPPSPCLFDGSLHELQSRFGLSGVIDQLVDWLEKAAAGQLIDETHGWEPTRREDVSAQLVFDADWLSGHLPIDGTLLALPTIYSGSEEFLLGEIRRGEPGDPDHYRYTGKVWQTKDRRMWSGETLTFVCRAADADGGAPIYDRYSPDSVIDIPTLVERADSVGIDGNALERSLLGFLKVADSTMLIQGAENNEIFAMVILAVRRPRDLIGAKGRDIEFIPYVVRFFGNLKKNSVTVKAAYHSYALSPALLQRASGFEGAPTAGLIVLAGCGSLGSKIGLHLGRAGFGQFNFIDQDWLAPHNLARHALLGNGDGGRVPRKAELMKEAFATLSHHGCNAFVEDFSAAIGREADLRAVGGMDASIIIDATASLAVLTAQTLPGPLDHSPARIIRTLMYGQGRCAVAFLEGQARSPRVDDLTAAFFNECRSSPALRAAVAGDTTDATRLFVGDNCSSLTSPMPDSLISRAAALVSLQLEQWLRSELPHEGQMCFSVADAAGIGADWTPQKLYPTVVMKSNSEDGWTLRVLGSVAVAIAEDVSRWGDFETGGALLGHVDHATRTIIVAAVVDAPPDSTRAATRFVLGIEGLEKKLRKAHEDSIGHLHFVGTWHSHPMGGKHSQLDRHTLAQLCVNSPGIPIVSLVWTPGGLISEVGMW